MKTICSLFALCVLISSCSKKDSTTAIDNGPIGGTYTFTSALTKTYDTIPGSGIATITEYTSSTTNHKGTVTVTASSINSKGLMYDYTTTGVKKEVNTSTGATITTTTTPFSGTSGSASNTFSSNYTIAVAAGELTIDDAQYLFNPAFLPQPANKKYSYTLTGNTLKVTTAYYNAGNKSRMINEATFTK